MMLSRKKSSRKSGLNYLIMVPIGLFLLIFQQKELNAQATAEHQKWTLVEAVDTVVTFDPATFKESVEFVKFMKESKADNNSKNVFFKDSDEMPEFPGGQAEMIKFLAQSIKYPAAARHAGAQGTVFVQFIVEKDGSLSNFEELKAGSDKSLFEESLRVLKLMPKWKPGKIDGKPVRVQFVLPVKFKLE